MKTIPLFSAVAANANLDFSTAIKEVLDHHWYVLGDKVSLFEEKFASYLGVSNCITVANGTDALEIALRGLGVAQGNKVVTVANAGFYGSTAIHAIGAVPLYVDVEEASLTMDPASLVRALEQKPKAVIVTHLYGQLANIRELTRISREAGIPLIEDCAQAHGAKRDGRQAGSYGDAACFSFYPTKNLGALGDGGAIVTNDAELASRLRPLRQYGWAQKYHVAAPGGRNSRLDELQAAILLEKLPYLDKWNAERRRIAERYNAAFASLPMRLPASIGEDSVAHLYVIRVAQREPFRAYLKSHGITTDIHYPVADHLQLAYGKSEAVEELRVTETACNNIVTLPCYPGLKDAEIGRVIEVVQRFFQG